MLVYTLYRTGVLAGEGASARSPYDEVRVATLSSEYQNMSWS